MNENFYGIERIFKNFGALKREAIIFVPLKELALGFIAIGDTCNEKVMAIH